MVLQNIFIDMKLHDLVTLLPYQLNNELYLHLKKNLQNKIEKKCIDIGYVCKIKDIIDYKNGYLLPEDLTGNIMFKITYNAKMCIPIIGIQIVCKVEQIMKSIIYAVNGPLHIAIKYSTINTNLFNISNKGDIVYKKNNKQLAPSDYIKITINAKRSYNGDDSIGVMGYLDDIATNDEIKKYMYREIDDDENDIIIKEQSNITLNEDELIDDSNSAYII